MIVILSFS